MVCSSASKCGSNTNVHLTLEESGDHTNQKRFPLQPNWYGPQNSSEAYIRSVLLFRARVRVHVHTPMRETVSTPLLPLLTIMYSSGPPYSSRVAFRLSF